MDKSRKTELFFIIALITVTISGGIYCSIVYADNTVPGAVCFAIGITSLVYWFLGGISDAKFNVGYLKLGGSIAALLGSFYLINDEMDSARPKCSGLRLVEPFYAIDLESSLPAAFSVIHNEDEILSFKSKSFAREKFAGTKLELDSGLIVNTNSGTALGFLQPEDLREKQYYNSISNSSDPGELVTFSLGKKVKNKRLDLFVSALVFRADGNAEFQFKSIENPEINTTLFIKNKGMQVVELGEKYYLVSATQADFENPRSDKQFIQLFIKPLLVK